jgi:predicted transcriptional regulator of viral defense system
MRELGPVIKEIEQLREILQVTANEGDEGAQPGAIPGAASNGAKTELRDGIHCPKRGPDGRAVRGSNKTVIMELVRANPGIAAPEIAALTDLKREVISATMYRLKKQGILEDYGRGARVIVASAKKKKFILELADTKPGITAAEVADVTGLDPTVTAVTIESLRKKGELETHGDGVALPS